MLASLATLLGMKQPLNQSKRRSWLLSPPTLLYRTSPLLLLFAVLCKPCVSHDYVCALYFLQPWPYPTPTEIGTELTYNMNVTFDTVSDIMPAVSAPLVCVCDASMPYLTLSTAICMPFAGPPQVHSPSWIRRWLPILASCKCLNSVRHCAA